MSKTELLKYFCHECGGSCREPRLSKRPVCKQCNLFVDKPFRLYIDRGNLFNYANKYFFKQGRYKLNLIKGPIRCNNCYDRANFVLVDNGYCLKCYVKSQGAKK